MYGCPRFHPFGYIGNAGFPVPPDARDAEPEAKWRWTEEIAEQDGAERKGNGGSQREKRAGAPDRKRICAACGFRARIRKGAMLRHTPDVFVLHGPERAISCVSGRKMKTKIQRVMVEMASRFQRPPRP